MSKIETNERRTVLVVDDIESIRTAIAEHLSTEFDVYDAADGYDAIRLCENNPIDLVITDIRMPGMGGLQLIKELEARFPEMQFALMTAYNVDDYIRFAREERIWNIIPKSTFLDLRYISVLARKLLHRDIFGIGHYFPNCRQDSITLSALHRLHRSSDALPSDAFHICSVTTAEENNAICDMVGEVLVRSGAPSSIRTVIDELSANAMVHAVGETRVQDPMLSERPVLRHGEDFLIGFGLIDGWAAISVTDRVGTLDRNEILYRLERQVTMDATTNLPVGLTDFHGRGLYISREQMDHLVFNIDPGKQTEIIALLNLSGGVRSRAISIFQLDEITAGVSDQ